MCPKPPSYPLSVFLAAALFTGCFEHGGVKPEDTGASVCQATEEIPYDGLDQDCDGFDLTDVDGDDYVAAEVGGLDCDDGDATVNPAASEVCDEVDNDCDGLVDGQDVDLIDGTTWYQDGDGDGYGDPSVSDKRCARPSGYVADNTDCDDSDVAVNTAGTEICNAVDDDCDGLVDDADSSVTGRILWYVDSDGDGYGDASAYTSACVQPNGYVLDNTDCDDGNRAVNPGAIEDLSDGIDNNCDGQGDDCPPGSDEICAALSCSEILAVVSSSSDGWYWLDPSGSGAAEQYACDMSTDGGGWTQLAKWDRNNDGDTLADFKATYSLLFSNMTTLGERTDYIYWNDSNQSSDAMVFVLEIPMPNSGEAMLDLYFDGSSMEHSGVWWFVEDETGAYTDLVCVDDDTLHCTDDTPDCQYDATDLSYRPYDCSLIEQGDWNQILEDQYRATATGELVTFHFHALQDDGGSDYAHLYAMSFWVR